MINICGLWKNVSSKGVEYFSGNLGDCKIMIFPNDKKGNDRAPDYRMVIAEKQKKTGGQAQPATASDKPDNPFNDSDVPF